MSLVIGMQLDDLRRQHTKKLKNDDSLMIKHKLDATHHQNHKLATTRTEGTKPSNTKRWKTKYAIEMTQSTITIADGEGKNERHVCT